MIWTLLMTMALAQNSADVEDALQGSLATIDTGLWLEDDLDLDAVVGGTPVGPGDWDDTVGIVMRGSYVGCTGTLIHPKVVLTATHWQVASHRSPSVRKTGRKTSPRSSKSPKYTSTPTASPATMSLCLCSSVVPALSRGP